VSQYAVPAECRSCGYEQTIYVTLPSEWTDSQLQDALDRTDSSCGDCGDQDWSAIGEVEFQQA
jgi:hypothetical protein